MTNQANIDININDAQVESLVQSLGRLSDSLNRTQREFNETERDARQAGTAMRQAGQSSAAGGRGIQQMGQKMAGATRAIVAGGAALGAVATAAVAATVAVKALEVGVEQGKEAFRAYISTSRETKEQFQDLTTNASQLQLQLGKTILELIGGEEAFDTFNDAIETGVQFLENFREAISASANGLSVAEVGARLLRDSFALLFRVLAEGQRVLETTVNALNFLGNLNFRNFISQQQQITESYREQRGLIYDLRRGEVDLSRRSARDPIRIAVEGAAAASDGVTEGDRQIISAIQGIQQQRETTEEILGAALKRALRAEATTGQSKAARQITSEQPFFFEQFPEAYGPFDQMEILLNAQRSIEANTEDVERGIAQREVLQQELNADLQQARRLIVRRSEIEQDIEDLRSYVPPMRGDDVGALTGAGIGAAGGASRRVGTIVRQIMAGQSPGGFATLRDLAVRGPGFLARGAARGVVSPQGLALTAGGAIMGAPEGPPGQADAMRRLLENRDAANLRILEGELALLGSPERMAQQLIEAQTTTAAESAALTVVLTSLGVEAEETADATEEMALKVRAVRETENKLALVEFESRAQAEREYFDFIQQAISGTKEEAGAFMNFIGQTDWMDNLFRSMQERGVSPEDARGVAMSAVQGEEGFSQIGDVGFSLARDLDNLEGFRGIAADDTFPSVHLLLEAINGELTEQERKWAELNGGIMEYMKAIEASKTATRNAFKTDAISGFTGAIEQVSATIGTAIAGGFDDGLKGGERVKKLLATILGDFLKTIGSTAIAQGAIVAFGDPAIGGLPNPARAAGLIAAGSAAVIAGSALSGAAAGIGGKKQGATSPGAGSSFGVGGGGGSGDQTTQIFIENRFGNRFDARELDRAAADSFARAAAAGQA